MAEPGFLFKAMPPSDKWLDLYWPVSLVLGSMVGIYFILLNSPPTHLFTCILTLIAGMVWTVWTVRRLHRRQPHSPSALR